MIIAFWVIAPVMSDQVIAQPPLRTQQVQTILAVVNGLQLTQGMVDSSIAFGEFLANHQFTEKEKRSLKEILIANFYKDPLREIHNYRQLNDFMWWQFYQRNDPILYPWVRKEMLSHIYFANQKQDETSPLMQVVYRYASIVAADPQVGLVVTDADIDALFASHNFIAKITGQPPTKPKVKIQFRKLLAKNFSHWSKEQKEFIATSEGRWAHLQAVWNAFPQEQNKMMVQMMQGVKSPEHVADMAHQLEYTAMVYSRPTKRHSLFERAINAVASTVFNSLLNKVGF